MEQAGDFQRRPWSASQLDGDQGGGAVGAGREVAVKDVGLCVHGKDQKDPVTDPIQGVSSKTGERECRI